MSNLSRTQLRQQMRTQRRALTPNERQQHSHTIAKRIATSTWWLRARHVGLYLANDGEVDLAPLIAWCRRQGKHCYLPALHPLHPHCLWFMPYTADTPLLLNRYGIAEPRPTHRARRAPWTLDVVLAPLVAFDAHGNRLGMGGGYYDRSFAYRLTDTRAQKPHLVGVAYDFQRVVQLPAAAWDVPLTTIVTERHEHHPNAQMKEQQQ